MSKHVCPLCGHPTNPAHMPFCSRRCHDRDLLQWLGDGYAIPGEPIVANADGGDKSGVS